jgi:hypothetical protein
MTTNYIKNNINQEKGLNYEIQIRDHIINVLNEEAYLWKDIPETILIDAKIIGSHNNQRLKRIEDKENPLPDTGIDILKKTINSKYTLVQCKNGYNKGVTMKDLAGFMCWMATLSEINGNVYYTNKLSINIRTLPTTSRIQFIKHSYIENEKIEDIKI